MNGFLKVLLVEDNPADARLLMENLREVPFVAVEVTTAQTLAGAFSELDRGRFDAVLLDLNLPDSDGSDTIRRMNTRVPDLPIIVLTGIEDEKAEQEAVLLGAQDFLVKGESSPRVFLRTLRYAVDRKRLVVNMGNLVRLAADILSADSIPVLLFRVAKSAREFVSAQSAVCVHGFEEGECVAVDSSDDPHPRFPGANRACVPEGMLYREIIGRHQELRVAHGDLRNHPRLQDLPEGHRPQRNALIVSLPGRSGRTSGCIVVRDKEREDFTEDDSIVFRQLATLTSLALQIHEARDQAQDRAHEAEAGRYMLERKSAELETALGELESFTSSVSHDLRAPLRAMDGFARIVMEECNLDQTGLGYLSRITESAVKMNRLIDDLLYLSRVTRQEMHTVPVDLSALAAEVIADIRESDPLRATEVQTHIDPGMVAEADAGLIRIALTNLLGNAWKFTSKTARPRIEFGLMTDKEERVFYVRDNGAGFHSERVKRLFIPFQRLHSDKEFPGTGIGLAIVKRVIGRHGGRIWAQGEPGKGATFYFTLG